MSCHKRTIIFEFESEGGNKSGLYDHLKMLIRKGKENNDSKVKLVNEDGETVEDEREVE